MRITPAVISFALLLNAQAVEAKEIFTKKQIANYLTEKNPYYYSAIGEKFVYEQKVNYQKGAFDTKLKAKYDNKDYGASEGDFLNFGVDKPLADGIDLSLDYRKATGTQEYNNIKTGEEGEMLLGIKIPIFSLLEKINTRDYVINSASLQSQKVDASTEDRVRLLHYDIVSSYYTMLYYKEVLKLVEHLLNNAKKRQTYVAKSVEGGAMPQMSLLEIEQQIINREQSFVTVENIYQNALSVFLKYLNLERKQFFTLYTLPSLKDITYKRKKDKESIAFALEHRPDILAYDVEQEKLMLDGHYSQLLKYPDLKLGVYGSHDLYYGNGFKVALQMDFPVERSKYKAKSLEIQSSLLHIEKQRQMKVVDITIEIRNIINSLNTLRQNIQKSKNEVRLVQKLESAEEKKYRLGLSSIFMLNQREMQTLQVKQKRLKYQLDYLLTQEELNMQMNMPIR